MASGLCAVAYYNLDNFVPRGRIWPADPSLPMYALTGKKELTFSAAIIAVIAVT